MYECDHHLQWCWCACREHWTTSDIVHFTSVRFQFYCLVPFRCSIALVHVLIQLMRLLSFISTRLTDWLCRRLYAFVYIFSRRVLSLARSLRRLALWKLNSSHTNNAHTTGFCLLPSQNYNRFRLIHIVVAVVQLLHFFIHFNSMLNAHVVASLLSVPAVSFFLSILFTSFLLLFVAQRLHFCSYSHAAQLQLCLLFSLGIRCALWVCMCVWESVQPAQSIHKTIVICFKCMKRAQLHSNTSLALLVLSSHHLCSCFFLLNFISSFLPAFVCLWWCRVCGDRPQIKSISTVAHTAVQPYQWCKRK